MVADVESRGWATVPASATPRSGLVSTPLDRGGHPRRAARREQHAGAAASSTSCVDARVVTARSGAGLSAPSSAARTRPARRHARPPAWPRSSCAGSPTVLTHRQDRGVVLRGCCAKMGSPGGGVPVRHGPVAHRPVRRVVHRRSVDAAWCTRWTGPARLARVRARAAESRPGRAGASVGRTGPAIRRTTPRPRFAVCARPSPTGRRVARLLRRQRPHPSALTPSGSTVSRLRSATASPHPLDPPHHRRRRRLTPSTPATIAPEPPQSGSWPGSGGCCAMSRVVTRG